MKKTIGLLALTGGLVAAGCAMVPHGVKSPATSGEMGVSGPGTLLINVGGTERGVQAINTAASMVVARIYEASTSVATDLTASDSIEVRNGKLAVATASVTSGIATLTLPALAKGDHVITVEAYGAKGKTWKDFVPDSAGVVSDATGSLIAQGETRVTTDIGLPYKAAFNLYTTFPYAQNLDVGSNVLVTSATIAGTTGINLRMANWNYANQLNSGSKIRLVMKQPKALTAAPTATASWQVGDKWAPLGFSSKIDTGTWNLDSTDKSYYWTDVDMQAGASSASYAVASSSVGTFTLFIPATVAPAGTVLTIIDVASGSSQTGSSTL